MKKSRIQLSKLRDSEFFNETEDWGGRDKGKNGGVAV